MLTGEPPFSTYTDSLSSVSNYICEEHDQTEGLNIRVPVASLDIVRRQLLVQFSVTRFIDSSEVEKMRIRH